MHNTEYIYKKKQINVTINCCGWLLESNITSVCVCASSLVLPPPAFEASPSHHPGPEFLRYVR